MFLRLFQYRSVALIVSILLHGVLLWWLLVSAEPVVSASGPTAVPVMYARLVIDGHPVSHKVNHAKVNAEVKESLVKHSKLMHQGSHKIDKQRAQQLPTVPSVIHHTQEPSARAQSSPSPKLVALSRYVYTRIARHARYPSGLSMAGKASHVLLQFVVYPDGHVNGIQVMQSSGDARVDTAAVDAVRRAMPFTKVSRWIKAPQPCRLVIHFLT